MPRRSVSLVVWPLPRVRGNCLEARLIQARDDCLAWEVSGRQATATPPNKCYYTRRVQRTPLCGEQDRCDFEMMSAQVARRRKQHPPGASSVRYANIIPAEL